MVLSQLMKTQVLAGNLNFSCYHIVNKCKQQWSDSTIYFHLQKVRLKIFKLCLLYIGIGYSRRFEFRLKAKY